MHIPLFNPIENLHFNNNTCFLSGADLINENENICVFPEWILERFSLRNKSFTMMDQVTHIPYQDIRLPCSSEVKTTLDILESEIRFAFENGYDAVKQIPEERLFLWMGKIVYGVLYHDLNLEMNRPKRRNDDRAFNLSHLLKKRFSIFHLMLQSLIAPIEFRGTKPWTISIVKLKYSRDTFNYRDEPVNLNFSLGMNGFGIIACLQDNGVVGTREALILQKIGEKVLHPIQFEELCGRYLYANYLLKFPAQFQITTESEKIVIEAIVPPEENDRLFAPWDGNMFAQVLTGYWEPWGFTKSNIFSLPGTPVSFLEKDYSQEFIEPESISLPF